MATGFKGGIALKHTQFEFGGMNLVVYLKGGGGHCFSVRELGITLRFETLVAKNQCLTYCFWCQDFLLSASFTFTRSEWEVDVGDCGWGGMVGLRVQSWRSGYKNIFD